jgi:hypothetical protein
LPYSWRCSPFRWHHAREFGCFAAERFSGFAHRVGLVERSLKRSEQRSDALQAFGVVLHRAMPSMGNGR